VRAALREYADVFGRTERYTIYDQGDMCHVLDRLLSAPPAGVQRSLCDLGQPGIAEVLFELSRAKNMLLCPTATSAALLIPARR
jgi:DNA helicase-2/ATP-dependent DNA helicase PcrA